MKCWYLCRLSKGVQQHLKISRACRQELQLLQDQQLLLTPFTVQTAADGVVKQWQRSVNGEEGASLQLWVRVLFGTNLVQYYIWASCQCSADFNLKESPCFSYGSVARHQRDMDFEANIFSPCIFLSQKCEEEKTISSHGFVSPSGRVEGAKNSVISR